MQVFEHFAVVTVLDDGSPAAQDLAAELGAAGCPPRLAPLALPDGLAAWHRDLQTRRGVQERGVLFLDPHVMPDSLLWSHHDGLVEHLEGRQWDMAFLGYGGGSSHPADAAQRPGLHPSNTVPADLCALALRGASLLRVLEAMPTRAVTGTFSAQDWLTIAAWLGRDLHTPLRTWQAWPALTQAPPPGPPWLAGMPPPQALHSRLARTPGRPREARTPW